MCMGRNDVEGGLFIIKNDLPTSVSYRVKRGGL